MVYSRRVWSRYQQTLARKQYYLASYWSRAGKVTLSAVHAVYFASRLTTVSLIPLSSYGLRLKRRRVIVNLGYHLPVVPRLCIHILNRG
jgi:hypothetical protein